MTMINFRIYHKTFIPGAAGYDSSGNPKQGKVRVVGEFDITSYTAGGEPLKKSKLGLSTVDHIAFEDIETLPTATLFKLHRYDRTNEKVIIYAADTAGAAGDELAAASGDLGRISFVAYGDPVQPTEVLISDTINNP